MTKRVPGQGLASVHTLLEALPYIREFHGRTVVIKYGGAAMQEEDLRDAFATDVVLLKYVGLNPVVVHGGGPDITRYMERLGMEVKFVEGVRVSDPETVEVAKMVLLGKVNADIVMRLNRHGQPAVGLSGEDGALFDIRPHERAEEIGMVGEIDRVDVEVLNHIAADYIPVIASAGVDREGRSYNVNADTAAGKVAAALHAYKALFLTDVAGWLADPEDEGTLRSRVTVADVGAELERVERWDEAEARGVRGGDRRRRRLCAHRRWPPPTLAAARAVHRRRRRDDGHAVRHLAVAIHRFAPLMAACVRAVTVEDLRALESRYAMDTYARAPVEFVRGEGARLWDSAGKEYLDFFAGLSVHNAGHCHPRIVEAIAAQTATIAGMSNLFYSAPAIRLSQLLAESSLGGRVFLCNSGAEASECAIKLVRKRAHLSGIERPEIVSLDGAFHGRTLGALAATPRLARDDLFGPLPRGFVSVPRDDPEALRAAVGESTAAVMIEPIQGEAGVFPIADEVLVAGREACDSVGAALVFDEVQCGMGRTGTLWAHEQLPVRPDVLTSAKALGGGLPVGAVITTPELADVLARGDHGSTFAGAPIAAAAAIAALGVIDEPKLLASVGARGEQLSSGLAALEGVAEVRGRGLMVGVTLADGLDAAAIAARALDAGLVLNVPGERMLRLLPPLVVGPEQVERGLELLGGALA